jgi:hypothetical protein
MCEGLRIMRRQRGSRGPPESPALQAASGPKPDAAAFARKLSELYGEPVDVDAALEAARNITAFFELLAEWDAADQRRQQT